MSGASERANGRASGPVLTSGFLVVLAHSAAMMVLVGPATFQLTLARGFRFQYQKGRRNFLRYAMRTTHGALKGNLEDIIHGLPSCDHLILNAFLHFK